LASNFKSSTPKRPPLYKQFLQTLMAGASAYAWVSNGLVGGLSRLVQTGESLVANLGGGLPGLTLPGVPDRKPAAWICKLLHNHAESSGWPMC
jgi:hypothetical protein